MSWNWLLTGLWITMSLVANAADEPLKIGGKTMGSYYAIVIDSPGLADKARLQKEIEDRFAEINRQMSTWDNESEISRFNRSDSTEWFSVGHDFATVTQEAKRLHQVTAGAVDATVSPLIDVWGFGKDKRRTIPSDEEIQSARKSVGMEHIEIRMEPPAVRKKIPTVQLSFSCLAPGYAADEVCRILQSHRLKSFVVDVGGENRAGDAKANGDAWRVGVESPFGGLHQVVELTDMAIATSGDYQNFYMVGGKKYSHVLDPTTGRPVQHPPASVSVVHSSCMTADGMATAMMVLGPERGIKVARDCGVDVMFLDVNADGTLSERSIGVFADEPQESAFWKKHVVIEGEGCTTAVAADFTGDGVTDIIADTGKGITRLFVGPDWKQIQIDDDHRERFIHSEAMDVDGDGDIDYVGACYDPGLIVWYEQPDNPLTDKWTRRLVDDQVHGIHGVIIGDVDKDGRMDLLATSAQPKPPFPNSLVWLSAPKDPRSSEPWQRNVFADQDAPGLTHYLGFGDVNGDGRPDAATAAKGGEQDPSKSGEWFAWWEAPENPRDAWKKHALPGGHPGATNIHPADVNADGRVDFVASRGHGKGVLWFEAPDWKTHIIDPDMTEPHCLSVVDIDADGDLDAVTCGYGSQLCAWYENNGKGVFRRHVVGDKQEAYDIRTVDLDGDQDPDILIAGRGSNNVVWYENPAK